jgi:alkaline phosphatase
MRGQITVKPLMYKKVLPVALLAVCSFLPAEAVTASPTNIIFFIGDGMGFEQVAAAGMYHAGSAGTLSFEPFPYRAEMTTHSANLPVTDSAASATAMATGHKVNNGVISMALPGDGTELQTLLEIFRDQGKSTGLVTTTYMTHATPACFGAHEPSRDNYAAIAGDYLYQTTPNVLLGGGGNGMSGPAAEAAGYTIVSDRSGMQSLDTESITRVSGQFGVGHMPYEYDGLGTLPHLSEMTATALAILDNDPDGFFLMVEGGRIDHAGHANDIQRNVTETVEFANAVQVAVDWASGRVDTLILVTADHETGGLTILQNNGIGVLPTVSWATTGHTAAAVPVYAWGQNADLVVGLMDNTDLFDVALAPVVPATSTISLWLLVGALILLHAVPRAGFRQVNRRGIHGTST